VDVPSTPYKALSDRHFHYPALTALEFHSRIAPTYTSVFEYIGRSGSSFMLRRFGAEYVIHSDDEVYYFNKSISAVPRAPGFKTTEKEYKIVKFLSTWVASFANERNPTPPNSGIIWNGTWEPWQNIPNQMKCLHINDRIRLLPDPISERLIFWKNLAQSYAFDTYWF